MVAPMTSLQVREYVLWACAGQRTRTASSGVLAHALCCYVAAVEEHPLPPDAEVAATVWDSAVAADPTTRDGALVRWATLLLLDRDRTGEEHRALAVDSFRRVADRPGLSRALSAAALAAVPGAAGSVAPLLHDLAPAPFATLDPGLWSSVLALRELTDHGGQDPGPWDPHPVVRATTEDHLEADVASGRVSAADYRAVCRYLQGTGVEISHQVSALAAAAGQNASGLGR